MRTEQLKARYQAMDDLAINSAIVSLLETAEGRKFLWWALGIGGVGQQPYAKNALDTAFNCGVLNVGQQFLDRITSVSPEGYVRLIKEMADERTTRNTALDAAAGDPADYSAN